MLNDDHPHAKGDGSWWEKDALGIPLCRVCPDCRDEKLSRYRPEILSGYSQADVDEPIEPEPGRQITPFRCVRECGSWGCPDWDPNRCEAKRT